MVEISLPRMDGSSERYRLAPPSPFPHTAPANGIRTVYAAAHVVADPLKLIEPWRERVTSASVSPTCSAIWLMLTVTCSMVAAVLASSLA